MSSFSFGLIILFVFGILQIIFNHWILWIPIGFGIFLIGINLLFAFSERRGSIDIPPNTLTCKYCLKETKVSYYDELITICKTCNKSSCFINLTHQEQQSNEEVDNVS